MPAKISICSNAPSNMTHFDEGKCYGFGNSLHNAPFQKVLYGQQKFEEIIKKFIENSKTIETAEQTEIDLIMDLQNLLKNPQQFWPDAELERRAPKWGQYLSSLNVNVPQAGYGSRTHTVILVDDNNKMHFYEETMTGLDPQGEWRKTHLTKEFFKN